VKHRAAVLTQSPLLSRGMTGRMFTNLDDNNSHPPRVAAHIAGLYVPALRIPEPAR
jgi:hypothetical protein